MSRPAPDHKHHASAQKRLLEAAVAGFFAENFPKFFGPAMRTRIARQLLELIAAQTPSTGQLHAGQCRGYCPSRRRRRARR